MSAACGGGLPVPASDGSSWSMGDPHRARARGRLVEWSRMKEHPYEVPRLVEELLDSEGSSPRAHRGLPRIVPVSPQDRRGRAAPGRTTARRRTGSGPSALRQRPGVTATCIRRTCWVRHSAGRRRLVRCRHRRPARRLCSQRAANPRRPPSSRQRPSMGSRALWDVSRTYLARWRGAVASTWSLRGVGGRLAVARMSSRSIPPASTSSGDAGGTSTPTRWVVRPGLRPGA